MLYFILFLIYSFIGFILETLYTFITKGIFINKKCFLLSPLCPVYGFGALAIILSTSKFRNNKFLTMIIGGVSATIIEYIIHYVYKEFLGVSIWDYSDISYNLNGRICLKFTFYWSLLSGLLVYVIHPFIEKNIPSIPKSISIILLIFIVIDSILSLFLYKYFGIKEAVSLSWLRANYYNFV